MSLIQLKLDNMRGAIPPVAPALDCIVAGGAVRGWFTGEEKLQDVDVFGPSAESLAAFLAQIKNAEKVDESKNADTYLVDKTRVQLIKHFRPNVQELLTSFDFNICQFAWDSQGVWATPEAVIGTLRAFKYQTKGFVPCDGTIRDISKVISDLTKEEVEQQVIMSPKGGKRIVRFD